MLLFEIVYNNVKTKESFFYFALSPKLINTFFLIFIDEEVRNAAGLRWRFCDRLD